MSSKVSSSLTAKVGHTFFVTSYRDRLRDAKCDFFDFLKLSLKYLENATLQTSQAFQINIIERVEKAKFGFLTYIEKGAPCISFLFFKS